MNECTEDIFVDVLNLPTRVLKFGRSTPKNGDEMVLFVPGNPGLAEVYIKFLAILQTLLGIPVWTISKIHTTHSKIIQFKENNLINGNFFRFTWT